MLRGEARRSSISFWLQYNEASSLYCELNSARSSEKFTTSAFCSPNLSKLFPTSLFHCFLLWALLAHSTPRTLTYHPLFLLHTSGLVFHRTFSSTVLFHRKRWATWLELVFWIRMTWIVLAPLHALFSRWLLATHCWIGRGKLHPWPWNGA